MRTWGVSDSLKLYNIENWCKQYFTINPSGILTVNPSRGEGPGVDLMSVVSEIREQNLGMPVLIRFQDIIRHRVVALNEAFKKAIASSANRAATRAVIPS